MDAIDQITLSLKQLLTVVTPYVIQFWDTFQDYVYLRTGLIAIAAYFLARIVAQYIPLLLDKIFKRLHFPVAETLLSLIKFPLFYITFIIGLIVAVKLSSFNEPITTILISILKSILIAIIAISTYRILIYVLERTAEKNTPASIILPQTLPLFTNSALVFVLLAAIHQIFALWKVDMTALLASAGIAGLAIGMASKDTLSDIIAGVLILTDNPYKLGDFIQLTNGTSGSVTHIGIRSTRIKTKDNIEIIVPNARMGNSEVYNESSLSQQNGIRITLDIRTAYGVDALHIRSLILATANSDKGVMPDLNNTVTLIEFDERYMIYRLMCWITSPLDRPATMARLREAIYQQFKDQDIEIALPAKQSIAISEQPDLCQQIAITEIPAIQQELAITKVPKLEQELAINKIPNLFGLGTARKIGANPTPESPPQPKTITKPSPATKATLKKNKDR